MAGNEDQEKGQETPGVSPEVKPSPDAGQADAEATGEAQPDVLTAQRRTGVSTRDLEEDDWKKDRTAWYWAVAVLALFWNLFGVAVFIITLFVMNSETILETLPPGTRAVYDTMPPWAIAAFAVGVLAGLIGSIALLFRKKAAIVLFCLSLGGILVQDFHAFAMAPPGATTGMGTVLIAGAVLAIAVYLIWFSFMAMKKGRID